MYQRFLIHTSQQTRIHGQKRPIVGIKDWILHAQKYPQHRKFGLEMGLVKAHIIIQYRTTLGMMDQIYQMMFVVAELLVLTIQYILLTGIPTSTNLNHLRLVGLRLEDCQLGEWVSLRYKLQKTFAKVSI